MSWQGVVGHDHLVERFRRCLQQGRLASTFLFVGPAGIGKRTFARKLAQAMLCSRAAETELAPCEVCAQCLQVMSDSHPDLQVVQKPEDKAYIPVELFIGDREHRMQVGLCHFMSLTPSGGKRRIAIIDDADWLNQEGANSLLKTLEEPSPGAVIILISTSLQRQLPTIRSRSQVVRFRPLTSVDVAACLLERGLAADAETAEVMASRAQGSVSRAVALADQAVTEFRREFWSELAKPSLDRGGTARLVNAFVDSDAKDAAAKRTQLRAVLDTSLDFYRAVARLSAGVECDHDAELQACLQGVEHRNTPIEVVLAQIDRCLDAQSQVNQNANLGLLVDAWICDLAVMNRTQQPLVSRVL